jgi:hypothetical protein
MKYPLNAAGELDLDNRFYNINTGDGNEIVRRAIELLDKLGSAHARDIHRISYNDGKHQSPPKLIMNDPVFTKVKLPQPRTKRESKGLSAILYVLAENGAQLSPGFCVKGGYGIKHRKDKKLGLK